MKSGTCGDYSNFMVSVFVTMGFEMAYAYVHKDCFGDEQDHICAAVKVRDKWVLIDATNPYRKWCGWDNEQWGVAYSFEEVPKAFRTIELYRMMECVERVQLRIDAILRCLHK